MRQNWSSNTRIIIVLVILTLMGLFIYSTRPLIGPLTVAGFLAYLLHPLVERLESRPRITHNAAVNLVYFPLLFLILGTSGTLIPMLVRQVNTLSDEMILIFTRLEDFISRPITIPIFGRVISPDEVVLMLDSVTESFAPAAETAIQVLEATSTNLVWLIVIFVTIFYLLRDWSGLRDWLIRLAPEAARPDMGRLLKQINQSWRSYMRGTLILMFIMAVFFIIVGLAIGLPGAVALGLLTGLLSMIPEIGPLIAGIVSVLAAFFQGSNFLPLSNFWFAILVAVIYFVVMQLKSLWLRPLVMGRSMHMNTGLVFIAVIGAALIYGVLAALIILPAFQTVGHIGHYVRCRLLNLDPWTAADTQNNNTNAAHP